MTKMEEKLIELGYEFDHYAYRKPIGDIDCAIIIIFTNKNMNKIVSYYVINGIVKSQEQINNLQQAYNEMQKDLEVLRQCYE